MCFDKYFGIWLLIKHLLNILNTLGQNLNIVVLLVQTQQYMTCKLHHMMQILVFFFMNEFIIFVIIQYAKLLSICFFALNLKICRILRFMIRSYDLQSHLPSMILCKILILTTLIRRHHTPILHALWEIYHLDRRHMPQKFEK